MRPQTEEPRNHWETIRLTEKEYVQLRLQMEQEGYLSESKYIRDRVFNRRIVVHKEVRLTDRNLRNQINRLSAIIAKVGVDYNQATRRLNSLAKATRPDGSPVINARAANYYLSKVFNQTKEMDRTMKRIIDLVEKLELDSRPRGGDGD